MPAPIDIKALRSDGVLQLTWPDLGVVRLPMKTVRCACSCANCVHEFTGERLLDPATVSEDIAVRDMSLIGNYAVKIAWSDGHDTGLYTWDKLHGLCREA